MKRILSFTLVLVLVFSLSAVFGTSAVAVELPEGIVKISDGSPVTKGSVSTVTNADTGLITYVLSDGASVSFTVNAEKAGRYKLEVLGVTVTSRDYPAEAYLRVYDESGNAVAAGGTSRIAKGEAADAAYGSLIEYGNINLNAGENTLTICPPARMISTVSKVGVAAIRLTYVSSEKDTTERYFVFLDARKNFTLTAAQSADNQDGHVREGGVMTFDTPELSAGRYAVTLRMGGKSESRATFSKKIVSSIEDSNAIVIPDAVFANIDNTIDYRITQELTIGEMNFDGGTTTVEIEATKAYASIGIACHYVVFEKVADAEDAKTPSLSIRKDGATIDELESGEVTAVYCSNGNQFARDLVLLAVSYDEGGVMVGYETKTVPLGDCDEVSLPLTVSDTVASVMLVLVDDLTNMRPYSDAVTVSR